jgi:hypothetical protein
MNHYVRAFLFGSVLFLFFAACNSSNPTSPGISDNSIIGDWNVISDEMHLSMAQAGTTTREDTTVFFTGTNTAAFNANHTFLLVSDNGNPASAKRFFSAKKMTLDTLTGTWTLSGNQITLSSLAGAESSTVSVGGDSMEITAHVNDTETVNGSPMITKGTSALTMTRE